MTDLTKLSNMKLMVLAASMRTIIITPQTNEKRRAEARALKEAIESEMRQRQAG